MGREDSNTKRYCKDCEAELPMQEGRGKRRLRCVACIKDRSRKLRRERESTPEAKTRMREARARPEAKAKQRERNSRPEAKARRNEYKNRPEAKAKQREHNSRPETKERRRENDAQPEIKERNRKYAREYRTRPEVKERLREYNSRPEVKERLREYNSRPDVKERERKSMQEYNSRPEVREHRREYGAEYKGRPGVKQRCSEQAHKRRSRVFPSDLIQESLPGDWVYVLRVEGDDGSPVKIGRSSKLLQRLRKHQRDNLCALRLVALIPGDFELEFVLHRLLAEYRLNRYGIEEREVFAPTPEVLRVIGILESLFPYPRPGLTDPQTLLTPAEVLALLEPDSSGQEAAE